MRETKPAPELNPFVHPAQVRLLELIDEAEMELMEEQDETQPLHDPLHRFHLARQWGVEPWVAAMLPVSPDLTTLQDQAMASALDGSLARTKLMSVIKQSLQALVLLEESENGELMALDDAQLVDFLEYLMNKLDTRIGRLRRPEEGQIKRDGDAGFDPDAPDEDNFWSTQAVKQRTEEFLNPDEDDHTDHVHWVPKSNPHMIPNKLADSAPDPDVQPGLAFTEPYPSTVAGEGPVQDPPANEEPPDWQPRLVPDEEIGPATHVPEQPVDLDAAERALARETAQLRQSAAGSSAAQLGGRHASPDDTLDDQGETGRRARED